MVVQWPGPAGEEGGMVQSCLAKAAPQPRPPIPLYQPLRPHTHLTQSKPLVSGSVLVSCRGDMVALSPVKSAGTAACPPSDVT